MRNVIKKMFTVLLIISVFYTSGYAGWIWDATKTVGKAGVVYGAKKGYDAYAKSKKSKIFTKKKVGDKTVYQREIDPEYIATDKYGNKIKNIDRMQKKQAPYVKNQKSGKDEQVQLHHSQQKNSGSLFELKESTHLNKNNSNGNKALHPYGNKQNPNDPVDRKLFNKERADYWKQRADEFLKGL